MEQKGKVNIKKLRKQSQRLISLKGKYCQECGSQHKLNRHHLDDDPLNVKILCTKCHSREHIKTGTWGKGPKKKKDCIICGAIFTPNHSKRHNTCSKECLSEIGRRNAIKRWNSWDFVLDWY